MGKIKQLLPHEAQKIAAGEVVERPANVVKELIENSLDAGATSITLHIEDGGKSLIHIIDNGCGMSEDDAIMSIVHHATSKISSVDELESISTFGFRGEALSSISAVSKVTLITKEQTAQSALKLTIEASSITATSAVAANAGTNIAITDLFYNVPARRKFLKTTQTEWRAILQLFQAIAIDYKDVGFKLFHDGRQIYHCPATDSLQSRIEHIFEPLISKHTHMFYGHIDRMNLRVYGALTKPGYTRYDKHQIFVFVNKRWVKNYKLTNAFIKGYQSMLAKNQFPAGAIFIEIDPKFVDINIHPRKEEVQFLHPKIVEQLIEDSVKECLEKELDAHLGIIPNSSLSIKEVSTSPSSLYEALHFPHASQSAPKAAARSEQKSMLPFENNRIQGHINQSEILPRNNNPEKLLAILDGEPFEPDNPSEQPTLETFIPAQSTISFATHNQPTVDYTIIGQALRTYIIIETASGLTFIDQHAAHERVLYERFKTKFEEIVPVRLMFPVAIHVPSSDADTIEPYLEIFSSLGIQIDRLTSDALIISQTPIFLKNQPIDDLIKQVIALIGEHQEQTKEEILKRVIEKVHAQLACKAAVKAGDELSIESMREIITQLYQSADKLTCPHGRPTIWAVSISDIEKKFKRDYR